MKKARFDKLITSMQWSLKKMRPFQELRYEAIQEYTGKLYGEGAGRRKVPVNMLEMAVTIYMQYLAAQRPSLIVNTKFPSLKRMALSFETALADYMKVIRIERVFQRTVKNAMFSIGCIKTGDGKSQTFNWDEIRDDPFLSELGDEQDGLSITKPYAESIDSDDLILDMGARRIEECRFIGHRYRVTKDELMDGLSAKGRGRVKDDPRTGDGRDRVEDIGKGKEQEPEPFDDMVECYEIYLPYERTVVTLQLDGDQELEERDYDGPDGGNYHFLNFHDVPNNVMPLAPVSLWLHLHRLGNNLMNKLGDQAERQKTLALYDEQRSKDAARIKNAPDGDAIAANPKDVEEKSFGGPSQVNFGFLKEVQSLFSYHAGNLDLLGGLGPQSATLGQDEMLAGSASKRVMDMQTRVMSHYEEVLKSLGWYVWNDPMYNPALTRDIGSGVVEHMSFTPEERDTDDIINFDFNLVPFSMTNESPSVKAQKLMSIVQGVYMPFAQQAQQQGMVMNMKELFSQLARLNGMEDILPEIFTYSDPTASPSGSERPGQSPVTRRESVRTNRSGATEAGKRDVMARSLMGVGVQQSEMDSLGSGSY